MLIKRFSLFAAACAAIFVGGSISAAHPSGREPWPWYLAGCRYAEIDNTFIRELVVSTAKFAHTNRACANAYDTRGSSASDLGHWDAAIAETEFGIRIDPDNLNLRGDDGSYSITDGRPKNAVKQFTAYLARDPYSADILTNRGGAREMSGDWHGAIKDYSTAIKIDPDIYGARTYRGRAYVLLGHYDQGLADLLEASKRLPRDPSTQMWRYIAELRSGHSDIKILRERAKDWNLNVWPGPVIKYFLGEISSGLLQEIAATDPDVKYRQQKCDAWFYLGEEALAHNRKDEARVFFRKAVTQCGPVDYEWDAARLELNKLGG